MAVDVDMALPGARALEAAPRSHTTWVERRTAPALIDLRQWLAILVLLDVAAAGSAALTGVVLRFNDTTGRVLGVTYVELALALPALWVAILWMGGAYRRRHLAAGPQEYARVANAGVYLLAALACTSFALHADLSREFVGISLPATLVLSLLGRYGARKLLHRRLQAGAAIHRVVVVGNAHEVSGVIRHMRRAAFAGFSVVGAALVHDVDGASIESGVELLDTSLELLPEAVRKVGADTIAVAGAASISGPALRRLSWQLEGTGIQLVVAPAMTDIAGPRIVVRPVDGLPLLHVDEPEFTGAQRLVKEVLERTFACLLLVVLLPVLACIAVAVRLRSPGPVFFQQRRVGRAGEEFTLWKFRTMYAGAHEERDNVAHLNEARVLFKIREDPRVTPVGRFLRRHSLDELPQLWNVVIGTMSLVGPRPPLREEVDQYGDDMRRRLLVKPGITGLWQVSGRADLTWEEAIRLDLYYVENWSVTLDAQVLWKTFAAVIHGRGAY